MFAFEAQYRARNAAKSISSFCGLQSDAKSDGTSILERYRKKQLDLLSVTIQFLVLAAEFHGIFLYVYICVFLRHFMP